MCHVLFKQLFIGTYQKIIIFEDFSDLWKNLFNFYSLNISYLYSASQVKDLSKLSKTSSEALLKNIRWKGFQNSIWDMCELETSKQLILIFQVTNLDRPIGLTVLSNGNVVVGVSGQDQVRIYNDQGDFVKKIASKRAFR